MSSGAKDGRDDTTARTPRRRCIATRLPEDKGGLIRFVVAPDGTVTPDVTEKLPGRGIYVAARADALTKAIERKLFAKAAGQSVIVPPDLYAQVDFLLRRHLADLLAMARRAGATVAGYEKARALVEGGSAAALFEATDGSDNAKAKMRPLARALEVPIYELLDGATLGAAFGREHVVHAALSSGRMADKVLSEARRVVGLTMDAAGSAAGGEGGAAGGTRGGTGTPRRGGRLSGHPART